ncbi:MULTISPECIES: hypothetical protein [Dactylosporangium]|uniref:Uncharacterized protein n=2 Tax=Dactylosporangium TaxID=35753 RepID=A0A9W6KJD6_9ACTN|nr:MULTISPECIES: hypothetical protein [Dactylosporangium]UAB96152.1 hypothetical protein Dvina_50805 [Dactylosporangium vinaceum]UWZ44514.1 hypothetical protein Dmats_45395 [Dactylosporangium matsuzakiense]GLL01905.1 hypothetical protein GCM10017581_036470 [Dactylosporangium matsuzakiense]
MSSALVLAAVPIVLAAGLLALMKVPTNLQLTVTESALVIEPQGLDRLWTRRDRIEVPLAAVASIRIAPRSEAPPLPTGRHTLHLNGIITAGVHGDTFWDVRRGDQLLIIQCRPGAELATLVLQFANPFATLTRTRTVISPHRATRA